MKEKANYNVGIYCRLSQEDKKRGKINESLSIENQKMILKAYVEGMGWTLKEIYVDDDFTGMNFQRKDFKRLERDLKRGIIDCVLVKKLDRLGRGIRTGVFIEDTFIKRGVRFIALQENEDTLRGLSPMIDFYHAMSGLYPKQVSEAVRTIKNKRASEGDFMNNQQPYGYMKSPEDYHKLIIDEYPASIVRRIFNEFVGGDSARMIANRLNEEGVDAPGFYHHIKAGRNPDLYHFSKSWGSASVLNLLRNEKFIGIMIHGKREIASIVDKNIRNVDKENWIVKENTHEALVSRELWDKAQERLEKRSRVYKSKHTEEPGLFSGIIRCADCGSPLAYNTKKLKNGRKGIYRCSRYNNNGKNAVNKKTGEVKDTGCTPHYIEEMNLATFVLNDIRAYAVLSVKARKRLIDRLTASLRVNQNAEIGEMQSQIQKLEKRLTVIDTTIQSLYEDKATGVIKPERFQKLSAEYDREQSEIEESLPKLRRELDEITEATGNIAEWLDTIEGCLNLEALDRHTVMGLVDRLTVSERTKVNGKASQEIVIAYRFIGTLLQDTKEDDTETSGIAL